MSPVEITICIFLLIFGGLSTWNAAMKSKVDKNSEHIATLIRGQLDQQRQCRERGEWITRLSQQCRETEIALAAMKTDTSVTLSKVQVIAEEVVKFRDFGEKLDKIVPPEA